MGSRHFKANASGAFSSTLLSMSGLRAIGADILATVTHITVRLVSCSQPPMRTIMFEHAQAAAN